MGELSISQIVELCQQGDQHAYGLLYTAMHDRLRAVCFNIVANDSVADDLLHDSFLLIFSKLNTLRDVAHAEGWMKTVARNLSLMYLQQRQRNPVVSLDAMQNQPVVIDASSTTAPVSYEELLRLVESLPEGYRQVFRLSVLEGMSHRQIADLLNIAPHTSSSQLYRAKHILRQSLRVILLSLLAVGLTLLVWRFSTPQQPDAVGGGIVASRMKAPQGESPQRKITTETTSQGMHSRKNVSLPSPHSAVGVVRQPSTVTDNKSQVGMAVDTTSRQEIATTHAQSADNLPSTSTQGDTAVFIPQTTGWPSLAHITRQPSWTVDLAYSGIGNNGQLSSLPIEDNETNYSNIDSTSSHRIPITVGITVDYSLSRHLSVGSGLLYTLMRSDKQIGNTKVWQDERQTVSLIGIPLRLTWRPVVTRRFALYTTANVTLNLPLHATLKRETFVEGHLTEAKRLSLEPDLQWSVGIGIGAEYRLTPVISLYSEPSLSHYFDNGSGIKTWYTEHPAALSIPVGIRLNW